MSDFAGKVTLVTGAASGIGRVVAMAFAERGATVISTDVDELGASETLRQIQAAGGSGISVVADVSLEADVERLLSAALSAFGRLDCASNNAGVEGPRGAVTDLPTDGWERAIAVNLTGTFLCVRHELRQMVAQGWGSIVNTASVAGLVGAPGMAAYAASKSGIIGLTRTAAAEVAPLGIRVNAVAPGLVNTGLTDRAPLEFINAVTAASPIGRMADAREIAAAVLWLCSDEASFVIGQTVPVDGGLSAV